jgi:hypothetical protein
VSPGREVRREELVIGHVSDAVLQPIGLKELSAKEATILLGSPALLIAIRSSLQGLDQSAIVIVINELVESFAPNKLDAVEASSSIHALELLDHLGVASHRSIEALVVAVDNHDQVVEALAACHSDTGCQLRLVHLTIPDEAPDSTLRSVCKTAKVKIAEKTRLVDS